MDEQTKEDILEYEALKIQAKSIDERLEELKPRVLAAIPDDQEVEANEGKFYIQYRTSYKYSSEVKEMEEALKAKQSEEKARGIATETSTPVLFYKQLT